MPSPDELQQLTQLLQNEGPQIARLWAKRLRREFPDLEISARDVRAPLGGQIAELTRLLVDRGEDGIWLWAEAIRTHGAQRYDQHFEADDLVRELKALEAVLLRSYWRRYGVITPDAAVLISDMIGEASAAVQASFARVLRTEETRFREAALMESVLHHVDVGIVVAEADGSVTYATPPVAQLLGVPARTLVGVRGAAGLTGVLQQIQAQREDGTPFRGSDLPLVRALAEKAPVREVRMRIARPDGTRAVVEMTATPLFEENDNGELVGAIQVLVDRTETSERARELAHAYDELRRLQARLLQRSRTLALGQLASGTAHALNNLLNVLRLRITLLRREFNPEHLDALDRTVGRVGDLMSRLQEFSVHRWSEELTDVPVQAVVREALELAQPELDAQSPAIRVERDLEPLAGHAHVDLSAFRELLVNLLLVARDRMAEGGTLRVIGREEGASLRLDLEDEGPTFTEGEMARLFDPLEMRSRAPHLSLVLAVARNQLLRWGGDLVVENRGGERGAAFRVRLPEVQPRREEAPATAPAAPGPARNHRPQRVLVVDDDADNASILGQLLGDEGYDVEVAGDAGEALRRFDARPFDTVFLDVILPDLTGWELARELRGRNPHLLLAMVTGADVRGQSRETLALVDAVFRKPVDIDAMDDFLRRPTHPRRGESPEQEGVSLPH